MEQAIAKMQFSKSFLSPVYEAFVDYVAVRPSLHFFTKTKFVAAMHHLVILNRPQIAA